VSVTACIFCLRCPGISFRCCLFASCSYHQHWLLSRARLRGGGGAHWLFAGYRCGGLALLWTAHRSTGPPARDEELKMITMAGAPSVCCCCFHRMDGLSQVLTSCLPICAYAKRGGSVRVFVLYGRLLQLPLAAGVRRWLFTPTFAPSALPSAGCSTPAEARFVGHDRDPAVVLPPQRR
jgi:hypothetical protein